MALLLQSCPVCKLPSTAGGCVSAGGGDVYCNSAHDPWYGQVKGVYMLACIAVWIYADPTVMRIGYMGLPALCAGMVARRSIGIPPSTWATASTAAVLVRSDAR